MDAAQLERMRTAIIGIRGTIEGSDIALPMYPGVEVSDLERQGATWAMHSFWPGHRPDQVLRYIGRGLASVPVS